MSPLEEVKQAFLAAIAENPLEPSNHYIYADWLEENGLDEESRIQRLWTLENHLEAMAYMDNFIAQLDAEADYGGGQPGASGVDVDELIRYGHEELDMEGMAWDDRALRQFPYGYGSICLGYTTPNFVPDRRPARPF